MTRWQEPLKHIPIAQRTKETFQRKAPPRDNCQMLIRPNFFWRNLWIDYKVIQIKRDTTTTAW